MLVEGELLERLARQRFPIVRFRKFLVIQLHQINNIVCFEEIDTCVINVFVESAEFRQPLHNTTTFNNMSNPLHESSSEFPPFKRTGLTTEDVVEIRKDSGFNELPVIEVSLIKMFLLQFTGVMPYMLEICVVVTIATEDWLDMGILLSMLLVNGTIAFQEQLEAAHQLAELTKKMEAEIITLRDGAAEKLPTRELVPGDVVHLAGGVQMPADVEWIDGDTLAVDTAPLTGEPLPRKYGSHNTNSLILCGTTVVSGEAYGVVRKIGEKTEAGAGQAEIAKDRSEVAVSVFEASVHNIILIVIAISTIVVLVILLIQGVTRNDFDSNAHIHEVLLSCLSIIVASIPIALPIVLQVTMALGAGKMASEFAAVVTRIPALQDIASMTVLCSDKTGTLTTAKITIEASKAWLPPGFTKEDLALYAYLACNPDKKEDPIDRSVINHFASTFGARGPELIKDYKKIRSVGFTPIYKRVTFEFEHPSVGKIIVAKGIVGKCIDTSDGGVDDHVDQWVVERAKELKEEVNKIDYDLSTAGYKTLGVSLKVGDKPWVFVGVLPQMDPPRIDTEITINALKAAGVGVKMITGDHLNIAKETSRKIGLGTDEKKIKIPQILAGKSLRDLAGTEQIKKMVSEADGFAQVLPLDKREVVEILRANGEVVGFTGDGVNDAPALSRAQCGIAVDDATDAAKNAAAMILTSEGLSAVYSAVVESRRIFKKLKAYVTYRIAASIQIVTVLAILILANNCSIKPLFIILLALFNDITMLPIAYDYQQASLKPENPDVTRMLLTSLVLGSLETAFSLLFAYTAGSNGFTSLFVNGYSYNYKNCRGNTSNIDDLRVEAAIFIQMFISAELLIFSTRAPKYFLTSHKPSLSLIIGVFLGLVIMTTFVVNIKSFGKLPLQDVLIIYAYCVICFFFVDFIKVKLYEFWGESTETLPDRDIIKEELLKQNLILNDKQVTGETGVAMSSMSENDGCDRASMAIQRMTDYAIRNDSSLSGLQIDEARQSVSDNKMRKSQAMPQVQKAGKYNNHGRNIDWENRTMAMPTEATVTGGDRPSFTSGSIRPNTPAALYARR
jgi:H+-transporting ATPase